MLIYKTINKINDIMRLNNAKPGPKIGKTIVKVTSWIMDNDIEDKEQIEKKIKEVYSSL